jgi:Cu/Ag efflux protein CusF
MRSRFAATLMVALAFAACTGKAPEQAEGVVRAVYPGEPAILIAHGEIRCLGMAPMTMEFVLTDPALAREPKVGDRVVFTAIRRGDDYLIKGIRKKNE